MTLSIRERSMAGKEYDTALDLLPLLGTMDKSYSAAWWLEDGTLLLEPKSDGVPPKRAQFYWNDAKSVAQNMKDAAAFVRTQFSVTYETLDSLSRAIDELEARVMVYLDQPAPPVQAYFADAGMGGYAGNFMRTRDPVCYPIYNYDTNKWALVHQWDTLVRTGDVHEVHVSRRVMGEPVRRVGRYSDVASAGDCLSWPRIFELYLCEMRVRSCLAWARYHAWCARAYEEVDPLTPLGRVLSHSEHVEIAYERLAGKVVDMSS